MYSIKQSDPYHDPQWFRDRDDKQAVIRVPSVAEYLSSIKEELGHEFDYIKSLLGELKQLEGKVSNELIRRIKCDTEAIIDWHIEIEETLLELTTNYDIKNKPFLTDFDREYCPAFKEDLK